MFGFPDVYPSVSVLANRLFDQPVDFDTSLVTSMQQMFNYLANFNQPLDFDTSRVTNMNYMLEYSVSFNQALDWDISKTGVLINRMFGNTVALSDANKQLMVCSFEQQAGTGTHFNNVYGRNGEWGGGCSPPPSPPKAPPSPPVPPPSPSPPPIPPMMSLAKCGCISHAPWPSTVNEQGDKACYFPFFETEEDALIYADPYGNRQVAPMGYGKQILMFSEYMSTHFYFGSMYNKDKLAQCWDREWYTPKILGSAHHQTQHWKDEGSCSWERFPFNYWPSVWGTRPADRTTCTECPAGAEILSVVCTDVFL